MHYHVKIPAIFEHEPGSILKSTYVLPSLPPPGDLETPAVLRDLA